MFFEFLLFLSVTGSNLAGIEDYFDEDGPIYTTTTKATTTTIWSTTTKAATTTTWSTMDVNNSIGEIF